MADSVSGVMNRLMRSAPFLYKILISHTCPKTASSPDTNKTQDPEVVLNPADGQRISETNLTLCLGSYLLKIWLMSAGISYGQGTFLLG